MTSVLAKEGRPGVSFPHKYAERGTGEGAKACQHWTLDIWPRRVGCGCFTNILYLVPDSFLHVFSVIGPRAGWSVYVIDGSM